MKLRDIALAGILFLNGCFLENKINEEALREMASFPEKPFVTSNDKTQDKVIEAYSDGRRILAEYFKKKWDGRKEDKPFLIIIRYQEGDKIILKSYGKEIFDLGQGFSRRFQKTLPVKRSFKREEIPPRPVPEYNPAKDNFRNRYPRRG